MSKFHTYSIILILSFVVAFNNSIMAMDNTVKADSVIVINPFPIPGNDYPRSPEVIPVSASYESLLSTVFLTFSCNLGEIEVEVMNTTTGGYDSGIIDTQYLSDSIPITMGSGHYIILFTLPSGRRYIGEFDV